jgi:hypothetical protein
MAMHSLLNIQQVGGWSQASCLEPSFEMVAKVTRYLPQKLKPINSMVIGR